MVRVFFFITLITLFLTSCAVGPDYEVPDVSLPEHFKNTEFSKEYTVRDARWWRYFHEPILEDLLEQAVTQNKDIGQALSRVNQSRAIARKSFAELLPGALLNADFTKADQAAVRFPGGGDNFRYEVYTASVDALWELDLFGGLRRDLEARNAEYDAREAELTDALRIVFSEIATAFIELRAAKKQLLLASRNAQLQRKSFELVSTQFEFGEVSELEPARAQAQLASTEAMIPALEAAVKVHMHRIAVLVGKQPAELYELLSEGSEIPQYEGPMTIATPEEVIRARPDVQAVERMLAAYTAEVGVAVAELFPKVSFVGTLGVTARQFSGLRSDAAFNSFGPNISWSAFDTGRLRSEVTFREEIANEALQKYEQTILSVLEEVENSLTVYQADQRRVPKLLEAEQASQKAFTLANSQYQEGVIDFLSVLSAQLTLLENESQLVEGKKQLALNVVNLYKALGNGWYGELNEK